MKAPIRTKEQILNEQHYYRNDYVQRITVKDWKALLLNDDDSVICNGRFYRLKGKNIGAGVYEISKIKD